MSLSGFVITLIAIYPALDILYKITTQGLGADPAASLNKDLGFATLLVFLLNLAIGHLNNLWRGNPIRSIARFRQALGIGTYFYLVTHVFLYFAKEAFEASAWTDLVSKTYLVAGLLAFIILTMLALTSNKFSQRILKTKWKRLHKLVHWATPLIAVHVVLIEKNNQLYYGLTMVVFLLLSLRLIDLSRIRLKNKQ